MSSKEKRHQYYLKNKEYIKEKSRLYRQKNKAKICSYMKKWLAEQRKNNPSFNINHKIASAYHKVLSGQIKNSKYFNIFNYSLKELKLSLESKFENGMSWDNYGEWHIDHIKPKSSFDCSNELDLIACWSLENLQPLWAKDNFKKGVK